MNIYIYKYIKMYNGEINLTYDIKRDNKYIEIFG